MKKTAFKSIYLGTNLFLALLLIDYVFTLFSLSETGVVTSTMGIVFDHIETPTYISTSFSVAPRIILFYFAILGLTAMVNKFSKHDVSH
ncbi:hypothetical protein ERUR111494_03220 [Erysipelothrix urinaevulpis]|uniref:hypothetical protein n=1 Tax=Erysipelothrix urinaevulpis TaxID=2683717 RepID=UPI0013574F98|nr:hypothetical protein [Erysipelothrix urinaevulpis]